MIDFSSRNNKYYYNAYGKDTEETYKALKADICDRLAKTAEEKFYLGCRLLDFYESKAYSCRASDDDVKEYGWFVDRNMCPQCFFAVCEIDFGLDKAQVSKLINVVSEFGNDRIGLKKQWKDFKWSILCEMLPLTPEQRKPIKSDWSFRRVLDYKKKLKAVSAQKQEDDNESIDFEALDAAIAGKEEDRYAKCKPAEMRTLLRIRDAEIERLKEENRSLREGEELVKLQEQLDYFKKLAIANMASGEAAD